MHILLLIGGFLLYEIAQIVKAQQKKRFKEWKPTQLDLAEQMYDKYGDGWMVLHNYAIDPSIRKRSFEIRMDESYGEEGYWKRTHPNDDRSSTVTHKKAWDEYWIPKLGENYAEEYPCLKFPDIEKKDIPTVKDLQEQRSQSQNNLKERKTAMVQDKYKLQICYPGIKVCIENAKNLDLTKPNLRYMLNDMKTNNHDYILRVITGNRHEDRNVKYDSDKERFSIATVTHCQSENYDSKECLDELFSIISGWFEETEK